VSIRSKPKKAKEGGETKMSKEKTKLIELTDEDLLNVAKWLTAASIMVEAKIRTPFSDSELKTAEKLRR
jgi:hypothetical protein